MEVSFQHLFCGGKGGRREREEPEKEGCPDPGREWGQEEKGTTEDEMAGWHH